MIFYLLLYYLTAAYLSEIDVEKLISFNLIIGTVLALIGILLFLFVNDKRIASVFYNSNPFGMYLAMLSLIGFGIISSHSRNRLIAIIIIVITDALILTGSRGL